MSASRLSIVCDGGTGGQVIDDPRDNPFPDALYPAGVGGIIGTVGGLRLERWAPSPRNGGRHQIGIGGRLTSESASAHAFAWRSPADGVFAEPSLAVPCLRGTALALGFFSLMPEASPPLPSLKRIYKILRKEMCCEFRGSFRLPPSILPEPSRFRTVPRAAGRGKSLPGVSTERRSVWGCPLKQWSYTDFGGRARTRSTRSYNRENRRAPLDAFQGGGRRGGTESKFSRGCTRMFSSGGTARAAAIRKTGTVARSRVRTAPVFVRTEYLHQTGLLPADPEQCFPPGDYPGREPAVKTR